MNFSALLQTKRPVVLDGAMGTELYRRGADVGLPLWSANSLMHAPDLVRRIHAEYIDAGADIITTNTFRTNTRTLERKGFIARWKELNHLAVSLAREACENAGRSILIAGGLAPVEDCYSPELVPTDEELRREHFAQAELLSSLGVDLLLVETMLSMREAKIAAEACASTGLEFAISFVTDNDGVLLSGESLIDATQTVVRFNPSAVLINCVSARQMMNPLRRALSATQLPVGCYANIGNPVREGTHMHAEVGLTDYLECTSSWIAEGAAIIGGCCGTTPEHIRSIVKRLPQLYDHMS
jgi:S-methylmethionine-dependent homocysteine/selenocysteine methylase